MENRGFLGPRMDGTQRLGPLTRTPLGWVHCCCSQSYTQHQSRVWLMVGAQ